MGGYAFGGGSSPRSPAAARSVARGACKSERLGGLPVTCGVWMPLCRGMEIRLTRRPGQTGTKKLLERYGGRLVCVRYRYDAQKNCRHQTVELIVETVPWRPGVRRQRRRDEEMIAVRIAYSASGRCAGWTQSDLESPTDWRPAESARRALRIWIVASIFG